MVKRLDAFPSLPSDLSGMGPITAQDSARIYVIWDHLAEIDATRTEEAMLFLMAQLKELVDADDAVWVGIVRMASGPSAKRDHQLGWRSRAVVHLEWTDLKRKVVAGALKAQEVDDGVPTSIELAKSAGQFRTLTLRELHDMRSFSRTEYYRTSFVPFDITDRLWCVFPVNDDCEVAYILDRHGERPHFTARDKALVAATLRGLTLSTARGYIKSVYQKFGVRGRAALMALWLGHA